MNEKASYRIRKFRAPDIPLEKCVRFCAFESFGKAGNGKSHAKIRTGKGSVRLVERVA